jgi:hypothetical protein
MDSNCKLSKKTCVPGSKDIPPLKGRTLLDLYKQLGNGWRVLEGHHLEKSISFQIFARLLLSLTKLVLLLSKKDIIPIFL